MRAGPPRAGRPAVTRPMISSAQRCPPPSGLAGGECRPQPRGLRVDGLVTCWRPHALRSDAYELGFGTLYTAIYRPADLAIEYRWPGSSWKHTIGSFATGQHEVVLRGD
jgi:hypothetical protein